jgi:hypothetical protein
VNSTESIAPPACHAIGFFDGEEQLCAEIAEFVSEGLASGQPALIVTKEAHRVGIARELRNLGVDVDGATTAGDLRMADAHEVLESIMVGGLPDATRYHDTVGAAVASLLKGRPGPVRIFGDMVDLLWQDGRHDAAIRIEILSNQLALVQPISVICGYSMGHFVKRGAKLDLVRGLHGRVHARRA